MGSKKEEIIGKVTPLIHSKGFENTKLSDILKETGIGKGQFYHYFASKRDLGEAVIDSLLITMKDSLFKSTLDQKIPPKIKLNQMLDKIGTMQMENEGKRGCPIGNLAIELSEHDQLFREKVSDFFDQWVEKVKLVLDELQEIGEIQPDVDTFKKARSLVALIEGALLLMKNKQDIEVFRDIVEVIRTDFQLNN